MSKKYDKGLTILELMIAIVIFSILMMIVSQIIQTEIRMFNTASNQNTINHKARTGMNHLLDEVRLNSHTYYHNGDENGFDKGVYIKEPGSVESCLININPRQEVLSTKNYGLLPSGTRIFFDYVENELLYREPKDNSVHLIVDEVESIELQKVTDNLLEIYLKIKSGEQEQELLTWIRMY